MNMGFRFQKIFSFYSFYYMIFYICNRLVPSTTDINLYLYYFIIHTCYLSIHVIGVLLIAPKEISLNFG